VKVTLQRGRTFFLLDLGDGTEQVFDSATARLYPPLRAGSAEKFGYWKPFEGDEKSVLALVAKVPKP
jgi:hypothetical protein